MLVRRPLLLKFEQLLLDREFGVEHVHAGAQSQAEQPFGNGHVDLPRLYQLLLRAHEVALLERVHVQPLDLDLEPRERPDHTELPILVRDGLPAMRLQ